MEIITATSNVLVFLSLLIFPLFVYIALQIFNFLFRPSQNIFFLCCPLYSFALFVVFPFCVKFFLDFQLVIFIFYIPTILLNIYIHLLKLFHQPREPVLFMLSCNLCKSVSFLQRQKFWMYFGTRNKVENFEICKESSF